MSSTKSIVVPVITPCTTIDDVKNSFLSFDLQSVIDSKTQAQWGEEFLKNLAQVLNQQEGEGEKEVSISLLNGLGTLVISVNTGEHFKQLSETDDTDFDTTNYFGYGADNYVMRLRISAFNKQFSLYSSYDGAGQFVINLLNSIQSKIVSSPEVMSSVWEQQAPSFNLDDTHTIFDYIYAVTNYLSLDSDKSWLEAATESLENDKLDTMIDSFLNTIPTILDDKIGSEKVFNGLSDYAQTTNGNYTGFTKKMIVSAINTTTYSSVSEGLSSYMISAFKLTLADTISKVNSVVDSYIEQYNELTGNN